jgi:hypothetical protein
MKHLEIEELISAVPVAVIVKMTRREKLQHWSTLIRQTKVSVRLLHQLEYIHPRELERLTIREHAWQSALGIAASDPVFQAQGLRRRLRPGISGTGSERGDDIGRGTALF